MAGGYLSSVCPESQPKTVDYVLRLLFSPCPIVLLLISCICVYFYPITEKIVQENMKRFGAVGKRDSDAAHRISFKRSISLQ